MTGEVELVRERYLDGKVRIERQVTLNNDGNYVNHGAWKMYTPAGDVIAEGQYNFGERNGMWTRWNGRKDSPLLNEFPLQGFQSPVHVASDVRQRQDGRRLGHHRRQRSQGDADHRSRNGQRNGTATTYLPNGKVLSQTTYQNGTPVGDLLEVNKKTGELARTGTYEEGRKVVTKTNYFPGSKKEAVGDHVPGREDDRDRPPMISGPSSWPSTAPKAATCGHGSSRTWYANGKPEMDGFYEYGKKSRHVHLLARERPGGLRPASTKATSPKARGFGGTRTARSRPSASTPNGNLIGEWRWWDEAGKLTKQQTYNGTESASTEPTAGRNRRSTYRSGPRSTRDALSTAAIGRT